ncbi:MAG: DNA internalization-related competence protein ComEC/Rec2, partial [Vulcanimicrobiaceae bacterium]
LAHLPSTSVDVRALLARAHHAALETLRAQLGEPGASIVAGELWGERSALPPDLRADFQESGTVHILVTAGLHVGLIAALVAATLSFFSLPRWCSCAITIVALWLFVLWSGAQLPAVRAATMASVALVARAGGAAAMSWNALALAAIAIAVLRPESVATPSFALSFACVGAIFASARPIDRWIDERASLPTRLREVVALTCATQLGTWPITAAVFLQCAPYAVFANLAIVPCVPVTMLLGMAELATQWCLPLAQALANLNGWLLAWIVAVVRCVGALPASSIPMTPAPTVAIVFYLATIVALPAMLARSMRTLSAAAIILSVSFVLWPPDWPDGRVHIIVLDVGQADAIVVQTPAGHVYEIDAGGRLERGPQSEASSAELVGERIVVPYLLRHGIHRIDAMILSHPHGDHAGGIAPVLRKLRVAEFADGGQTYGGHAYRDALDVAHAQGVPMVYPRAGGVWRSDDGVALQFIGPSLPFIGGRNAINDNSVAFMLLYQHFRMLFTGDAGSSAEQRFLDEGVDLHADVLKVGHHGSAYGSTPAFISAVDPRYAIVSVGRHNMFGHPAPSTIATLKRFGAAVYRTDENGAVSITSDGTRLDITAMLGR